MLIEPWRIQLLGGLELQRDGARISRFPTLKVGLVLAYLAVSPTEVRTREELAELFWPDSTPEAGRVSLRQALSSLRRLLEPPNLPTGTVLESSRSTVRLVSEAVRTDLNEWTRLRTSAINTINQAERLQRLREAVTAYAGPFLPGAYMDWALCERQYQQEQYIEILISLSHLQAQSGDSEGAITTTQLLLRTDPLNEDAHVKLMVLYGRDGKTGMARQQYAKLARLLQSEMGMKPGPEARALFSELDRIYEHVSVPEPTRTGDADEIAPLRPHRVPADQPERPLRLPLRLTRFFGREIELEQLSEWLCADDIRLMTLTGMGGVGKTRLALEAAENKTRFRSSITFVPLSDLPDPEQFLPAILQSLGMPAIASADPFIRLSAVIGAQPHLLVLDNFEQIADRASDTLWKLLAAAPALACLVTSRQALNISGEYELCLLPLPLPEMHLPAQDMIANAAVQMLMDRMRTRRPDFQITSANANDVASLCGRLEGIPLAVELAAGWARDLTINQMLARLDNRFDLLVSRQRGVAPRHQSLRAAVESSYQLLDPQLQALFSRLSVFKGGWRDEMATIAQDSGGTSQAALDGASISTAVSLRTLREHSLVTVQENGDHVRYGMLETLRAFGQEMLTAEQKFDIETKHAEWLLEFANRVAGKLRGREQATWLDRLEEEQDNFRSALEFCSKSNAQTGLRLCNALYWFWYVRSSYREGEQWTAMFIELADAAPKSDRAWGLVAAGHFANCQSHNRLAVERYKAAKAIFEEIGVIRGIAHCISRLGNAAQELRDIGAACWLCAEAIALFRTIDDPSGLLLALFYYLNTLLEVNKPEEGEQCFAEAYALAESLEDLRFQSLLQFCFSNFRRRSGDISGALESFRNAIGLQTLLREPLSVSYILRDLSYIIATQGKPHLAVTLYGAMRGLRRRIGNPLGPHEDESTRILEEHLHARINESEYVTAFGAGENLDFDSCLAIAVEATASG